MKRTLLVVLALLAASGGYFAAPQEAHALEITSDGLITIFGDIGAIGLTSGASYERITLPDGVNFPSSIIITSGGSIKISGSMGVDPLRLDYTLVNSDALPGRISSSGSLSIYASAALNSGAVDFGRMQASDIFTLRRNSCCVLNGGNIVLSGGGNIVTLDAPPIRLLSVTGPGTQDAPSQVPEPSTLLLLGSGLGGFALVSRLRR